MGMLSEKRFAQGLLRALEATDGKDVGYVRSACLSMLTFCRDFATSSLESILASLRIILSTSMNSPAGRIQLTAKDAKLGVTTDSSVNMNTLLIDLANLRAVASIATLSSLRRYIIGSGNTLLMILSEFAKCLPNAHGALHSRQEGQPILAALEESCLVMIEIVSQVH